MGYRSGWSNKGPTWASPGWLCVPTYLLVEMVGRMKGLNGQCAYSLLELSIFTIYLMKGLPASQFKVKVNIFVIVLILQLRSATVVIAYLMMKQNMTCKQVTISSTCLISVMITL